MQRDYWGAARAGLSHGRGMSHKPKVIPVPAAPAQAESEHSRGGSRVHSKPQTWQVMNQIQDPSRELSEEPKKPGTKSRRQAC